MALPRVQYTFDLSKPIHSLVVNRPEITSSSSGHDLTEAEKRCRKYFSKNVKKLSCLWKCSVPSSHLKNVRHLRIDDHIFLKTPLRAVKTLSLSCTKKNVTSTKMIKTQISDYKSLQLLKLTIDMESISLNRLKRLYNLRELSLVIASDDQLFRNAKTLLRLRYLRKFSLSLFGPYFSRQKHNPEIVSFCTKLLKKKRLTCMNLDLTAIEFERRPDVVESLLDTLQETKLPDFHIHLVLPTTLDLKKVQTAIDYADIVTMKKPPYLSIGMNNSTQELEKPNGQVRRVIELGITNEITCNDYREIDTCKPFNICESFNALLTKSTHHLWPDLDKLAAKNLRDLTFYLESNEVPACLNSLQALASILENSPYLKHLCLINFDIINPSTNYQRVFENISSRLETLRFELLSIDNNSFRLLEKLLNLPNLKELWLRFKEHAFSENSNFRLSFKSLSQLTTLKISLPAALNRESQLSFIDNIRHLYSLQNLEIRDASQFFEDQNLRKRFLQTLYGLRKLKMVDLFSLPTHMAFRFGEIDNDYLVTKLAEETEGELKELFVHNKSIERFCLTVMVFHKIIAIRN